MRCWSIFIIFTVISQIVCSAIPIWELLDRQEKMDRLMHIFLHLINVYCESSSIPDCDRVLTIYGVASLVNQNDDSLDKMDPDQKGSRDIVWGSIMKGFQLPKEKINQLRYTTWNREVEYDYNMVPEEYMFEYYDTKDSLINDPHPYAVRVPPPSDYIIPQVKVTPSPSPQGNNLESQIINIIPFSSQSGSRDFVLKGRYDTAIFKQPPKEEIRDISYDNRNTKFEGPILLRILRK